METHRHPIEDVHGVGPVLGERLRSAGYCYAEDLLRRDELSISSELVLIEGVTASAVVCDWIPQARFLRLPTMSPSAAAALASAGLRTYEQVAYLEPARIADLADVPQSLVFEWQLDAAKRITSASITVQVVDEVGQGIPSARAEVVDPPRAGLGLLWTFDADEAGVILLEYLAAGPVELFVLAEEFGEKRINLTLGEASSQSVRVSLASGGARLVVDEFESSSVVLAEQIGPVRRVSLDSLAELPDSAEVFAVARTDETSATLTSALMRKVGPVRELYSVAVDRALLGPAISAGMMVRRTDGVFERLEARSIWSWRYSQLAAGEEASG